MMKIGTTHHLLARLAAAVAAVSVILALIAKLVGQAMWVTTDGYMTLAIIALLFAIYFCVEGWVDAAKKAK